MNTENANSDIYFVLILKLWIHDDDEHIIHIVDQILARDLVNPFKLIRKNCEYKLTLERLMQIKKHYNVNGIKEYIPCNIRNMDVLIELVDETTKNLITMIETYLSRTSDADPHTIKYYLEKLEIAKKREHLAPGRIAFDERICDFYNKWSDGKASIFGVVSDKCKELWINFYNYNKYSEYLL